MNHPLPFEERALPTQAKASDKALAAAARPWAVASTRRQALLAAAVGCASTALSGCLGGGGSGSGESASSSGLGSGSASPLSSSGSGAVSTSNAALAETSAATAATVAPSAPPDAQPVSDRPATTAEAVRFLQQTTMGTTQADIDRLMQLGYSGWLNEQFTMPVQFSHVAHVRRMAAKVTGQYANRPTYLHINASMWKGMVPSADQLRQRVMFGLSQIFVVSLRDGATEYLTSGLAAYVDMLYAKCFGNFRDLLESVTRSTAMGAYLAHLYNRKENPNTGEQPDQNFARELMQLFTIGLWELNQDGTRKLDAFGQPIPTYGASDIVGVSRVMTGWAFEGATDQHWGNGYVYWSAQDMPVQERPMQGFARYHSTSEKRFLGVTIPASSSSDPVGDLRILLDRLFNHPNVGPFIGRQLILRLVASNPSKDYVSRVAGVFNNNGSGVRGDMKAVITAILMDPEARNQSSVTWDQFGRIREPILRMTHLMRVFKATSPQDPDDYGIGLWSNDRNKRLWQTPLGAYSVFNFYFPDHQPPGTELSRRGLVAPEMQIHTQSSVSDIGWHFVDFIQNGGLTDCCSNTQRNRFFLKLDYSEWLPLLSDRTQLIEKLNLIFTAGQMSTAYKTFLANALASSAASGRTQSWTSGVERGAPQIQFAEAMYTLILSPEYVVQK